MATKKATKAAVAEAPAKSKKLAAAEYVALHRIHHNEDEFEPGAVFKFKPWPVSNAVVKGKLEVTYVEDDVMEAHIQDLLDRGVIAPNDKNAEDRLAASDAHREAAARKAG
jgi:hypothetical protein